MSENPSLREVVICAECNRMKGPANHWFILLEVMGDANSPAYYAVYAFSIAMLRMWKSSRAACGEACLAQLEAKARKRLKIDEPAPPSKAGAQC